MQVRGDIITDGSALFQKEKEQGDGPLSQIIMNTSPTQMRHSATVSLMESWNGLKLFLAVLESEYVFLKSNGKPIMVSHGRFREHSFLQDFVSEIIPEMIFTLGRV